ncbi:MAG: hypothetical protein J6X88_06760 [Bacteroidales bacterium]|nr:hypothetical protein [Bacteroidales bacterium]
MKDTLLRPVGSTRSPTFGWATSPNLGEEWAKPVKWIPVAAAAPLS